MFFPTHPRYGSPTTMVHFAASRRKDSDRLPLNPPSDSGDDQPRQSSGKAESSDSVGLGLMGIMKASYTSLTSLVSGDSPGSSSKSEKKARFERPSRGERIKRKSSALSPIVTKDTVTKNAAKSPKQLTQIPESDHEESGNESVLARSTPHLGDSFFFDPPALPSPLDGPPNDFGDPPTTLKAPDGSPLPRSGDSSVLATKFHSERPSGKSTRRQTLSGVPQINFPPFRNPIESSESEDAGGLTEDSDLDSDDKALYSVSSSAQSSSAEDIPLAMQTVRGFSQRRDLNVQGQPSQRSSAKGESLLTHGLSGSPPKPHPKTLASKRSQELEAYRDTETQLRARFITEANEQAQQAQQGAQALDDRVSKLSSRTLGKVSLLMENKLLGIQGKTDKLLDRHGIHKGTGGINEEKANLQYQIQGLTKGLDTLEEKLPFKIQGLTEPQIEQRLYQYTLKHKKHATQLEAHMKDLFAQREKIRQEQAKLDTLEVKYTEVESHKARVEQKLSVYRAFRQDDILGQLSELPESDEDELRAHLASNYTIPEIAGVKKELEEKAHQSPSRHATTTLSRQQKDQQLSERLLSEGDSEPEPVTQRVGLAKGSAERQSLSRVKRAQARMQLSFLDTVIRRQNMTMDNILTRVDRYLSAYKQALDEPAQKLSKRFSLAELISARAELQQRPTIQADEIRLIRAAIDFKTARKNKK